MSSKAESFSLTWAIKNFSLFLSEKDGCLKSYFLKTENKGKNVELVLSASQSLYSLFFKLSALKGDMPIETVEWFLISSSDEITLKKWDDQSFSIEYNKINGDNGQSVLPNDILTVRCRMWGKAMKPGESYIHSVLHKVQLSWNIKNFHKSVQKNNAEHVKLIERDSMQFEMKLSSCTFSQRDIHLLKLNGRPGKYGWTSFIECKIFNESLEVSSKNYNKLRTRCESNFRKAKNYTDINLSMECIVALHKSSTDNTTSDRDNVPQESLMPSNTLSIDLLLMYRESRHSDITINTKGRSLMAHKNILSARSSVFRSMFEKDQMSEGQSGVVDIEDIDGDTMDRMLVFLYSNSLEDLNWKEAVELYYAADKYEVLSLKQTCAVILEDHLATDNACEGLVLADAHSDEKLMVCVMDFISGNREVLSSAAWRELEESNPRLTTKALREILMKNDSIL